MKILSLFDGMSCGRIACERAGIPVDQYFASEVETPSITVAKHNYPDTIELGDVTKIFGSDLPQIDLLIGGSPCQSFSNANQYDQSGFEGKSGLFWHYVRLLKETKPKYFFLENVKMKPVWRDVITNAMGVQPIEVNSSLVSAQNRKRLYWTNITFDGLPNDKGILLKDIIMPEVEPKYFLSVKAKDYMSRLRNDKPRWEYHQNPLNGKASCLTANMYKGVPYGVIKELGRRLTPIECERLQTVPDNYTSMVADTHRYKMLGNGWTVDVISHFLRGAI